MGLGGGPSEWDDYEWFRLADLPAPRAAEPAERSRRGGRRGGGEPAPAPGGDDAASLDDVLTGWLEQNPLWRTGAGTRLLLADLDNLRAEPRRWRARMAAVVALAREADHVAMAGQTAAVARARPHLAEFAGVARGVADGSDLADFVLLAAADAVHLAADGPVQAVVVSNDNIFAGMADWGPLTVLSPGADALSERLRDAAGRVVDLVALEQGAPAPA